jgi:RNA polymerase sigma-70 factor (ECF subfamily)
MEESRDTTLLLARINEGDAEAREQLIVHLYSELRRLASRCLSGERADHSLQATGLVHEAYLRIVGTEQLTMQDRAHFFAIAAQTMRRVLVDHARSRRSAKRGSGAAVTPIEEVYVVQEAKSETLLALDTALQRLELVDERQCRIVELRYFGGLSMEEVALALDISSRTAKRDWKMARAWVLGELGG